MTLAGRHPGAGTALWRRAAHAALCVAAFVPWLLGALGFGCALLLALLADRVWPNATWGNCWTQTGPRWWRHGGYLLIRWADGQQIGGVGGVPHAIWVHTLPDDGIGLLQTKPLRRRSTRILPWYTLYFELDVIDRERPHNSSWSKL
jgi:hypothetical protein